MGIFPVGNLPEIPYISTHQFLLAINLTPTAIMKQRERLLEVADLKAVAHVEDELVLFIDSEDPNIPSSLCVQADFGTRQFGPVQPMSAYLESNSYRRIHDRDRRISYRQRIREEMSPDTIALMLSDFAQKQWLNLEYLGLTGDTSPGWLPGG
jgi:hypothetical protein